MNLNHNLFDFIFENGTSKNYKYVNYTTNIECNNNIFALMLV